MITNSQILQNPPQGSSPLADLVKGKITRKEFERQVRAKWEREDRLCNAVRQIPFL
jgi:hypothetical protein